MNSKSMDINGVVGGIGTKRMLEIMTDEVQLAYRLLLFVHSSMSMKI